MKLRKLLFVGAYPPPYGGIASHLHDLLPRLHDEGYEIVLLTLDQRSNAPQPGYLKRIFINTKEHFTSNRLKVLFSSFVSLRHKNEMPWQDFVRVATQADAINETAAREKVDAVFLYDNYNGFVIPMLKRLDRKRKLVLMIFGDFYLHPKKYLSLKRFMHNVFSNTDVILSSSRYCADSVDKVMGMDFPVQVIYVGVDHDEYCRKDGSKMRERLGIPPTAVVYSFLGRMNKSMGMDFLLKIAPELLDISEELYLLLAGAKGDLSAEVEALCAMHPRVRVCTDIPFEEKSDFYAASDVFMAPTMEKHACMGVSIKEAMACGRPVLASDSGGIPEAIENGLNGFMVPFGDGGVDRSVFVQRARELALDGAKREELGRNGREKVLRLFSNDETVRKYLAVIKTLEQMQ